MTMIARITRASAVTDIDAWACDRAEDILASDTATDAEFNAALDTLLTRGSAAQKRLAKDIEAEYRPSEEPAREKAATADDLDEYLEFVDQCCAALPGALAIFGLLIAFLFGTAGL